MSVSTYSDDLLEQAGNLASWLVGLGDNDWASYQGSTVEQCKHLGRKERIVGLIKASRIETTGRIAFVFRCRGPFVGTLKPTPRETFPGNVILIFQREPSTFYLNGILTRPGDKQEIDGPTHIEVIGREVVFFLATFTKKA
ncbi:hypothetical protein CDV36_016135 [Fusarium kuroshium]|uniref:Uncharacterized protein n=2 Tax=Fusarium solani species complex TaxID=232080 RepID=A0A3M2QZH4_9HYPO|nr:hypothetical protein CDV36_016135 [Fusarium kuroshium]RSL80632.1 hypothetical protein CEP52_017350 [Fusarium oligoseptatum]